MISFQNKRGRLSAALLLLAACCACSQSGGNTPSSAAAPKSIVTTFSGPAGTSRAFAWYTEDPKAAGVLELAQGDQPSALDGAGVVQITASNEPVETEKGRRQAAHKAVATGLTPGQTYIYRVGTPGDKTVWSEPAVFTTEGASEAQTVTFLNVTDSQGETEADFAQWSRTLDKAFSLFPDARFIVHNGDLTENPEDETAWDAFFRLPQKWLTRIPLMPVTGNHDEIDGIADRYLSHFSLPANGAKGPLPGTSYSFDYGPVHVAVLNTEGSFKKQADWLRQDLSATNKPWKLVAIHRGAYGGSEYDKAQDWAPLFDEFQVDLVLQGHNHEYSRSYPLRGGQVTSTDKSSYSGRTGTVYTVVNTSGTKFNDKKEDLIYHAVHFQNKKQMFAGITVTGNTLTFQAYDADGKLWDRFVLQH
ncbi:purple acid phosphatase family protein [Gorillibacterium sp. sgz5001074]|uniref:purple acid phosphatase family protein n=1 Tax=Gorillibacterium sp. sgz5001074 TaxID=3446695 RepID=UPI003F6678DC